MYNLSEFSQSKSLSKDKKIVIKSFIIIYLIYDHKLQNINQHLSTVKYY